MALVDKACEPSGGELARDLRAVQIDARQRGARQRAPIELLGVGERALVQRGFLEAGPVAAIEVAPDRRSAEAEPAGERLRDCALSRRAVAQRPALKSVREHLAPTDSRSSPMLSMSRWIAAKGLETDVVFFHCARSRRHLLCGDEVGAMAQNNPRFAAFLSLTREGRKQGWQGLTGYLDRPMLERIAPDFVERAVYVCGPAGFMSRARALFEEVGFALGWFLEFAWDRSSRLRAPAALTSSMVRFGRAAVTRGECH